MKKSTTASADMDVLYRLALASGTSLDLEANCTQFLDTLIDTTSAVYAAVLLRRPVGSIASPSSASRAAPRRSKKSTSKRTSPPLAGSPTGGPVDPNLDSQLRADFCAPTGWASATSISREHPLLEALGQKGPLVTVRPKGGTAGALTATIPKTKLVGVYQLADVGFLELITDTAPDTAEPEWHALAPVIARFAQSIQASIAVAELKQAKTVPDSAEQDRNRFRDFAEVSADWFFETNADLAVTYLSENHDRLTGLAAANILNRTPEHRWLSDGPLDASRAAFVEALRERRPIEKHELRWEGADGVTRIQSFSAIPIFDRSGNFEGFRGSVTDVTGRANAESEQARLEAQLKQAQKMEAIGQLTGGIAHDFNNILATVLGFTELARDVVPPSEERLDRYLEEVQAAGERARNLVSQMLTYSRGGSGEKEDVRVAPVLTEATRLLRSTLPSSILVNLSILAPDAAVSSDGVSLQQVLMNLCINARDAMNSGKGQIDIVLEEEHEPGGHCDSCHAAITGGRVVLTVHDSGTGIEPEVQARMFDPFFSTKPSGEGTGMGLSMVHGIVHRHHGHVRVTSKPGYGTTIRIHWPALETPVVNKRKKRRISIVPGKGERILVVDDEVSVGGFLGELLGRRGYVADVTESPEEARDWVIAEPEKYALLVTDRTMPMLTGDELIEAVREVNPTMPVVLCTGYSETDEPDPNPNSAFLRKPVSAAELVNVVHTLLNAKRPRRARRG